MQRIDFSEALAGLPGPEGERFRTVFEHGTLSVEVYAPRGTDPQNPHTRDEAYVVIEGEGVFVSDEARQRFGPGDFLFAPAGVAHRFEEFSGDLAVWVIFYGPEGGEKPHLEAHTPPSGRRVLPPVFFLIAVVLMVGLNMLAPGAEWIPAPWNYLGALLIMTGGLLGGISANLFTKYGTTIKPFEESSYLMVEGPYRFTRNPIYVGGVVILLGIAVLLSSVTPFLVIPVFVWLIRTRFIAVEERMLEERFGEEYLKYKAWVRRWI